MAVPGENKQEGLTVSYKGTTYREDPLLAPQGTRTRRAGPPQTHAFVSRHLTSRKHQQIIF